jgi:toxin ParE1/3/4
MMRIRLAPQARADLDAIWLFIARESGSYALATRIVESITDKFGLFAKFPYIGRELDSIRRPGLRTFPVNNYIIFYRVKSGEIRIPRIIHSSRDIQAILGEE